MGWVYSASFFMYSQCKNTAFGKRWETAWLVTFDQMPDMVKFILLGIPVNSSALLLWDVLFGNKLILFHLAVKVCQAELELYAVQDYLFPTSEARLSQVLTILCALRVFFRMAGGNMHCSCPMWTLSSLILLSKPFSRCRQFSYMLVLRGTKLCGSPELSLCAADFLPIPSPVNCSHLGFSKLSLLSPFNPGDLRGSA